MTTLPAWGVTDARPREGGGLGSRQIHRELPQAEPLQLDLALSMVDTSQSFSIAFRLEGLYLT